MRHVRSGPWRSVSVASTRSRTFLVKRKTCSSSGSARAIFERLRAHNAEGPRFSFFDGPVTANKAMGVHTAWGRTLKDVFLRYKVAARLPPALPARLGLPGPVDRGRRREAAGDELQEGDRAVRPRSLRGPCREVVAWSSEELRRSSERLGHVDGLGEGLLHLLRHQHRVHLAVSQGGARRGWLVRGHRSTEWCPRCGTSLSQHELSQAGVHQDREDPALWVRLPLIDRPGEALVIWTTTPWTLPANVAAAVQARHRVRPTAVGRLGVGAVAARTPISTRARPGSELVGLRLRGPVRHPGARRRRASIA